MTVRSWIKRRRESIQLGKDHDNKNDSSLTTDSSSDSDESENNINSNSNHEMEVSERSDDSSPSQFSTTSSTTSRSSNNKLLANLSPANQSFVERFGIDSDDDRSCNNEEEEEEVDDEDDEEKGLFDIDLDYEPGMVVEIEEQPTPTTTNGAFKKSATEKKKLPRRTSTSAHIVSFFETFRDGEVEEIVFE